MHGMIFSELHKYVTQKLGPEVWDTLVKKTENPNRTYLAFETYPDEEAIGLVSAAAAVTGKTVGEILEDFGSFIVPDLVSMYHALIRPEWKALDLIERTEEAIHRVVRVRNPGAKPPEIVCRRKSDTEVEIRYKSARKMCSLAKGIIQGIGKHYNEKLQITETGCMLKGALSCVLLVTNITT